MTRLLTAALAALVLAGPALAQAGPPIVHTTAWKCDQSAMGDLAEMARERMLPIAQELKAEGQLLDFAVLGHDWGDEWNFVIVLLGADLDAVMDAGDALRERYDARHDDSGTFLAHCPTHRDNVQRMAWFTEDAEDAPDPTGVSVVVSHFACPFSSVGDIVSGTQEIMLPAAQASVDAGEGYFMGASTHLISDEWTVTLWRGAHDVPALMAFNDDINRRAGERAEQVAPDRPNPLAACAAHKDNIYRLMAAVE